MHFRFSRTGVRTITAVHVRLHFTLQERPWMVRLLRMRKSLEVSTREKLVAILEGSLHEDVGLISF